MGATPRLAARPIEEAIGAIFEIIRVESAAAHRRHLRLEILPIICGAT
jgi:hypothetical protein